MATTLSTEDKLRDYLRKVTVELADTRRRVGEPIAIIGISCRYPGSENVDAYWDLLRSGRDAISDVPPDRFKIDEFVEKYGVYTRRGGFLDDITGWDAEFFGQSPQEALRMDPQQRMLMELVWEAFENAGTPAPKLAGSKTAVMVGFSDTLQYGRLQADAQGWQAYTDVYLGQGSSPSVVAGRIAYHYDLHGPTMAIDTACSSSLVAVHLAAESLRRGECDLAVAGGGFLVLQPDTYVYGCATSMFSRDGMCKTFDSGANGYVIGEGGGIVLLARLSDAVRDGHRIRAVIRGSAVNQDGRSNGLTAPNRSAQVDVIRQAHVAAQVNPDEILYVEAHGSATKLGDAIELGALHDVFGGRSASRPLHVGAVKTNIGHTQSAAGIAGLIKSVLVLENDMIPPNLNTEIQTDSVPVDGTIQPVIYAAPLADGGQPRLVGVSSFGWSGTNAHMVLEAAPARPPVKRSQGLQVLPVSAASENALRSQLEQLTGVNADLADVAFTLQTGRAELEYRRAVVGSEMAEVTQQLAGPGVRRVKGKPKVAFLLPGVGDQYPGLGRELYQTEPVFAAAVDECLAAAESRCRIDLRSVFFDSAPNGEVGSSADSFAAMLGRSPAGDESLSHAELAHPFLFVVEYALAKLLAHRGVTPDVLIGYSLGEYVAACLAGVFSLEDALWVVVERARLISSAPTGHMIAAACDMKQATAVLQGTGAEVDIAAISSPEMTVLSGTPGGIEQVSSAFAAAGIAARRLRSAHAFHSSLLEPAREKLEALIASVPLRTPSIAIISNVTGALLDRATDPAYWADHLCKPVRFADGVAAGVSQKVDVFVELGPGQTLGGLVRQNAIGGFAVLGTLPGIWPAQRPSEQRSVLEALARLWEIGAGIDWHNSIGRKVDLPSYPFQRTSFWPAAGKGQQTPAGPEDLCYTATWRQDITRATPRPLTGSLLVFDGIGSRLADQAEAAGISVAEVVPGTVFGQDGRRFTVDPANPDHYRQVIKAVQPSYVVHAWSMHELGAQLHTAIKYSFNSLLLTVQAFNELPVDHAVRLLTVTQGAAEIVGGDLTNAGRALVHGLARVAQAENANLGWRGVDLDDVNHILAELKRDGWDGDVVGWRNNRRWVKGWSPIPLESTENDEDPWRAGGTYLITGGTRGLGLSLAHHLADHGVRKLALVSRSASRYSMKALEAKGVEVLLLNADAGVAHELSAAFESCRTHFGALDGVIHAAGLPAGGMISNRTVAETTKVLAPKVLAMGPITELIQSDSPPELVVLYGSAVTVFGGLGEGDYCAANSVLDAYAPALSTNKTRVLTVAWGPWQHDDWQSSSLGGELAKRVRSYRETYGFTSEGGCALLDRIVAGVTGSVVAVRQPLEDALRDWSAITNLSSLVSSTTAAAAERFPRPQLRVPYVAPRTELETTVAEVWGAYLGIDQIGANDPFFDLGGNSLVGMAMVTTIEKRLDRRIAPAVLFEHPTVAAFAAALSSTAKSDSEVLADSSARGDRRRRAREPRARKFVRGSED